MWFWIEVKQGFKVHRLVVERLIITDRLEQYRVKGGNKSIVLESNRPLFRSKGLKSRRPDWKIIEGSVNYAGSIEPVITEIMKFLDKKT